MFSLLLWVGLSGCWAPRSVDSHATVANPTAIDAREYDRVYRAAELELREQGYVLDWHGHRYGRLTTLPRATPTLLEPWHHASQSAYPTLSATLNQERHRITILIDPSPPSPPSPSSPPLPPLPSPSSASCPVQADGAAPSEYLWRVEVMIERAQYPQRRLAGSSDGDAIWSELVDTPAELKERGVPGAYWMPIGRDTAMEQRLIAAILRRSVLLTDGDLVISPSLPQDAESPSDQVD